MRKTKSKKPAPAPSREYWKEIILPELALSAMRRHKDGLAAAMVYCTKLGVPFPGWVRDRLAAQQTLTTLSASRRRQKYLHRKKEHFMKNLVRYWAVVLSEKPEKHHNKWDDVVDALDGSIFATDDASGLKKSYYAFRQMFGSRFLGDYVARRILAAEIKS
jgi:hypothetical protein